jgi:NDP-sugar pyrophosphorylase family protein
MEVSLYPAVILAGGLAKRLHPVTMTIPKSMVDIAGEPFVAHQLRLLKAKGIDRVIFCVGHLWEQIEAFVGDGSGFGVEAFYSADGPVLLGTAGAIRKALPLLPPRFFVIYGDSYLTADYAAAQRFFDQSSRAALMTVFRNEDQFDRSNVEFDGREIVVYDKTRRTEAMHHIDYGLGMFDREVFERMDDGPKDLATVYQELLGAGQLAALEVSERFYETGSFAGVAELSALLSGGATA